MIEWHIRTETRYGGDRVRANSQQCYSREEADVAFAHACNVVGRRKVQLVETVTTVTVIHEFKKGG